MKHAKPRETVTAVLFLLLLAAGCIYALYPFFTGESDFRAALGQLRRGELTVETFLDEADYARIDDMDELRMEHVRDLRVDGIDLLPGFL